MVLGVAGYSPIQYGLCRLPDILIIMEAIADHDVVMARYMSELLRLHCWWVVRTNISKGSGLRSLDQLWKHPWDKEKDDRKPVYKATIEEMNAMRAILEKEETNEL